MVRKFKVLVTHTTEVEVEIDTDSFDKEALDEYRDAFFDLSSLSNDEYESHARNLAIMVARDGREDFIEGYGFVRWRDWPMPVKDYTTMEREKPTYEITVYAGAEDFETEVIE